MSLLSLAVTLATAGSISTPDPKPVDLGKKSFWLDGHTRFGTVILPDLDGEIVLLAARVDAAIPVGYGHIVVALDAAGLIESGDDEWGLGNPYLGFTGPITPEARFVVGFTLPLLDQDDEGDEAVAVAGLFNANLRQPWTWFPNGLGVIVGADIETPVATNAAIDADIRLAALVPVGGSDDNEPLLLADLELGFRYDVMRVGVGLVLFDEEQFDDEQERVTLSLGVRVPAGRGLFYADLTVALDEPRLFDDGAVPSLLFGFASAL